MKVVILAGGLGTRLSEETHLRPKPMVEIGGKPILWHIMKIYSHYGFNEFIICLGYKGHVIKEYFTNYFLHSADITVNLQENSMEVLQNVAEPWKVTMVDTGQDTMTGGRLKRIRHLLDNEDAFCFTYGDGVIDMNISNLIQFHKKHGKLASMTVVYPPGRFGNVNLDGIEVAQFKEKPAGGEGLINGGFFILSPKVIDYIDNDQTSWEQDPLTRLAEDRELCAYKHTGFWRPMDTLRDKEYLEKLWVNTQAPWRIWDGV